eukprot:TRINITY_DN2749_c0_g1_i11.p2 TRINITY_DN2749_c0_g1~~TRINITY_DN2749_c0_g1_i11.p2  ORF type:complete len:250 (+),score=101.47 TRINITY_DN2749_c0_g1_i11:84-752(+)
MVAVAALLLPAALAGCPAAVYRDAGLGANFNETVAHAIHSMTVEGLRLFNPQAGPRNGVPTVNRNMRSEIKVVEDAPLVGVEEGGFVTEPMHVINAVFAHLGEANDGLGESWTPVERIVHEFHMRDLWHAMVPSYKAVAAKPPSAEVCSCLLDTKSNGIHAGVQWVAEQYKQWTPITLLNRPIPKLTDKPSWNVWRERITHYYDAQSLYDAAVYLYCAVGRQ